MGNYPKNFDYEFFADNLVEAGDTWALLADMIRLYELKYGCLTHHDAVRMIRSDVLKLGGRETPHFQSLVRVAGENAKVDNTI